jgi:hypothetical protein
MFSVVREDSHCQGPIYFVADFGFVIPTSIQMCTILLYVFVSSMHMYNTVVFGILLGLITGAEPFQTDGTVVILLTIVLSKLSQAVMRLFYVSPQLEHKSSALPGSFAKLDISAFSFSMLF